jgi:pimeloyl-ACP methyl ester carboxylesterase
MEKSILIEKTKINYVEKGEGFPLLLVHGMGSAIVWDSVIDDLSLHSRVLVIDLPGFGKSDKPEIPYTVKYYVDTIYNFIKELKLDKVNIAGLSLGGLIVSDFAYTYPELIENLIIVSSAGLKSVASFIRFPVVYNIVESFMKVFVFSLRKSLRKYQEGSYYDKNNIPEWVFNKYFELMQYPKAKKAYFNALKIVMLKDENFPKRLSKITAKTLIIWGENDPTFSLEYAEEFHRLIKNSTLKILPKCGHTVTIEDSKGFCLVMKEFLSPDKKIQ